MTSSAQNPPQSITPLALFAQHERSFATNRFVYPVLSRRSGGLSIGGAPPASSPPRPGSQAR